MGPRRSGYCRRNRKFYGIATITDKGQIAIPAEARKCLNLNKGDKLLVIERRDGRGINLVKDDMIEDFLNKLSKD